MSDDDNEDDKVVDIRSAKRRYCVSAAVEAVEMRNVQAEDGTEYIFVPNPPDEEGWGFTMSEARDFARALVGFADEIEGKAPPLDLAAELGRAFYVEMEDRFKRIAAILGDHLDRRPFDNLRAEAGSLRIALRRVYKALPEAVRGARDYGGKG